MRVRSGRHLKRVRALPCALKGKGCFGNVCAHHPTGGKGIGQKNDDTRAFPLCAKHHTERHSASGYFKGWDKVRFKAWEAAETARTQALLRPSS